MSGTAQAVGVSVTRCHCSLAVQTFFAIASLSFSAGCEQSHGTPSVSKTELASNQIDAGVIFSNRSSYLCLPLSRFGISSSKNIQEIASSCECVRPSLVRYSENSTTGADGLQFEFIPEDTPAGTSPQTMHLAVDVRMTMVDGATRTVTVNFLEAQSQPNMELQH